MARRKYQFRSRQKAELTQVDMTAIHELERAFCNQIENITEAQAKTLIQEAGDACAVSPLALDKIGASVIRGSGLSHDNPYA